MSNSSSFLQDGLAVKVVGRYAAELLPLLQKYPVRILLPEDSSAPELVIAYGGDGTLLGAERDFPGVPKLPLRDKSHNPRCERHSEEQCLEAFFGGAYACETLGKLCIRSEDGQEQLALNDIVLSRQFHPLGAIRCRIEKDGILLRPQVIADCLVFSTPSGSTGYFQSVTRGTFAEGLGLAYGNPMEGEAFQIFPANSRLEIKILRGPAFVQADNSPEVFKVLDGKRLTVQAAPQPARVFGMEAFRCRECYLLRRNGTR